MTLTIPLTEQIAMTLRGADQQASRFWHTVLAGWPPPALQPPAASRAVTFDLSLTVTRDAPQPPSGVSPIFQDKRTAHELGLLHVYQPTAEQFVLHFPDGALVTVDVAQQTLRGVYTAAMLRNGRLEDVLFTSLAPLLRRHDCYLVHAFAAVCPASSTPAAALIVGPTRSGKTTTGLQLVLDGWRLLANDVVLLRATAKGDVWAYPWPGLITVRPRTFGLLPQLAAHVGRPSWRPERDVVLTSEQIAGEAWGTAVPVKAVYFPQIESRPRSQLVGKNRGVALARLLEESLDRWDHDQIAPHSSLLRQLVSQATTYRLHLGQDMAQLPSLLSLANL